MDSNDKVCLIANAGKGEMVRQELTSGWATSRLGKPHLEQDQIEGPKDARPSPRVGRLTLVVTPGLDRWSPLRPVGAQNSAYRSTCPVSLYNDALFPPRSGRRPLSNRFYDS